MKTKATNQTFRVIAPAVLCLAALILFVAAPAAAQSFDRPDRETGLSSQQGWYDPSDWFDRGGPLDHESDWYDYSFDFGQRGMYGYYEPEAAAGSFGFQEEQRRSEFGPPGNVLEENYYTGEWYDRGGAFERWLDKPVS